MMKYFLNQLENSNPTRGQPCQLFFNVDENPLLEALPLNDKPPNRESPNLDGVNSW